MRILLLTAACMVLCTPVLAQDASPASFAGAWDTTYGLLIVEQDGGVVRGTYSYGGGSSIAGTVSERRLTFTYTEPTASGDGWFELSEDAQSFAGQWRESGSSEWAAWSGTRAAPPEAVTRGPFEGLYDTTYGRMRLSRDGDRVTGFYSYGGGSTIEGTISGDRLEFRYREPTVAGEGFFVASEGGRILEGQWREEGGTSYSAWRAERGEPEPGVVWLVVLEAPWETSLSENEYAFGDMLRAYFERMPHVRVRHRRLYDLADFRRASAELAYLAEPVALLIASHGSGGFLTINADRIGADEIRSALQGAPNVFALHFSACDIMVGDTADRILAELAPGRHVALSGYGTSVDWSASALIEFLYLDLILGRGVSPTVAGQVVLEELGFAGDAADSSGLGPARFRIVTR